MSRSSITPLPSRPRPRTEPASPEEPAGFGIASTLLPVRLVLQWGESVSGALFLRKAPSPQREPETVGARLNEPDAQFLPFAAAGRVELVRLAAVAYLEHAGELPEVARLRELGAAAEPVEIELLTGETVEGELLAIARPDRRRLSDLLNRGETFLPLVSSGRVLFVNRDAMARVRGRE